MGAKILVVDDNKLNIKLFKDILEDEGYEVFSLNNGLKVIDMCYKNKPDIILLDIMMPGMDGYEVCKAIKNEYDLKDIPIIMVTAKTEGRDVKKGLELGAFDYIKKPVDEVEVVARVQSALRYKKNRDDLKEMATIDGLTGIYNRKLLMELFEKEYFKQVRKSNSIAFVMIDIDRFKKVNDNYGHIEGDRVLKELADILMQTIRRGDIVGRYGGEEFALSLSETSEEEVIMLCERIRSEVEEHDFQLKDRVIHITVSLGVCIKTPDIDINTEEMIRRADNALYMAKENGRNRVEKSGGRFETAEKVRGH